MRCAPAVNQQGDPIADRAVAEVRPDDAQSRRATAASPMPMKLADFLSTCDRVRRRSTQEPFDPWLRKQRLLSRAITPSRSQSVLDNSEEGVQRRVVAEFVDGSRHLA